MLCAKLPKETSDRAATATKVLIDFMVNSSEIIFSGWGVVPRCERE
jgi:hypothetical protein